MRQLFAALALLSWGQSTLADAMLVDQFVWHDTATQFGGFSGFHLDENGVDFVAISDRGNIMSGQILREGGRIVDVAATPLERLKNLDGKPIRSILADAEGLAVDRNGTIYVSFEGNARVWTYAGISERPEPIFNHPDFRTMQGNSSLEALAVTPDGILYTLPERSGRANKPFPVYRSEGEGWDIAFQIPRRGQHLVVGADIGPDDMLYVLERDFTGIGFRTRVRRFRQDGSSEETLIDTGNATHDNLEGISVWEDAQGLRITMISDDNFRFLQQTEIVEYRLSD